MIHQIIIKGYPSQVKKFDEQFKKAHIQYGIKIYPMNKEQKIEDVLEEIKSGQTNPVAVQYSARSREVFYISPSEETGYSFENFAPVPEEIANESIDAVVDWKKKNWGNVQDISYMPLDVWESQTSPWIKYEFIDNSLNPTDYSKIVNVMRSEYELLEISYKKINEEEDWRNHYRSI